MDNPNNIFPPTNTPETNWTNLALGAGACVMTLLYGLYQNQANNKDQQEEDIAADATCGLIGKSARKRKISSRWSPF